MINLYETPQSNIVSWCKKTHVLISLVTVVFIIIRIFLSIQLRQCYIRRSICWISEKLKSKHLSLKIICASCAKPIKKSLDLLVYKVWKMSWRGLQWIPGLFKSKPNGTESPDSAIPLNSRSSNVSYKRGYMKLLKNELG